MLIRNVIQREPPLFSQCLIFLLRLSLYSLFSLLAGNYNCRQQPNKCCQDCLTLDYCCNTLLNSFDFQRAVVPHCMRSALAQNLLELQKQTMNILKTFFGNNYFKDLFWTVIIFQRPFLISTSDHFTCKGAFIRSTAASETAFRLFYIFSAAAPELCLSFIQEYSLRWTVRGCSFHVLLCQPFCPVLLSLT